MEWIRRLLSRFGLDGAWLSISVPLGSGYVNPDPYPRRGRVTEVDMQPSYASDYDPESIKGIKTSRDFKHAHPELVKRFQQAVTLYEKQFPGRKVIATCTYRSPEEQKRLYAKGRFGDTSPIMTNADGKTKQSDHNKFPARAVDAAILDGGKCVWDEAVFYPLGVMAREAGLDWGGFWLKFQDIPHFGLPKEVA